MLIPSEASGVSSWYSPPSCPTVGSTACILVSLVLFHENDGLRPLEVNYIHHGWNYINTFIFYVPKSSPCKKHNLAVDLLFNSFIIESLLSRKPLQWTHFHWEISGLTLPSLNWDKFEKFPFCLSFSFHENTMPLALRLYYTIYSFNSCHRRSTR